MSTEFTVWAFAALRAVVFYMLVWITARTPLKVRGGSALNPKLVYTDEVRRQLLSAGFDGDGSLDAASSSKHFQYSLDYKYDMKIIGVAAVSKKACPNVTTLLTGA